MDWQLLGPGIGLTLLGFAGVIISFAGIAKTFLEGMHSVSAFVLVIGLILLTAGIFKDGIPTSTRAKALIGISLVVILAGIGTAVLSTGFRGTEQVTSAQQPLSPSAEKAQVSIVEGAFLPDQANNFVPKAITVVIGVNNTVVWTNKDSSAHTVTSDDRSFDSLKEFPNLLQSGQEWEYTFGKLGTFAYHCVPHPWMKGTVVVIEQ